MQLYQLPCAVIQVKGNAANFINGLSANALDKPMNAFLNLHGRIIATCWQQRISDEEFYLVVPNQAAEALLAHLNRYAKLSRAQIIPTDLKAYLDLDAPQAMIISQEAKAPCVSDDEFTAFRLKIGLPLMGIDYQADEFILNVHEHNYTSYTKGCFLGQEPVAKVHNRSKPTRKLIVKYVDECSDEEKAKMTSQIKDPANGRIMGFVFVKNV